MLIRVPESWPMPVAATVAMAVLAVLDLAGAFAAKEAVERRSALLGGVGVALFVALFWVYASSLQYAELAPVTFGWIVILQIGVLVLDRYRYQVGAPRGAWVAVTVMIAAQAWLVLGPTTHDRDQPAPGEAVDVIETAGWPELGVEPHDAAGGHDRVVASPLPAAVNGVRARGVGVEAPGRDRR